MKSHFFPKQTKKFQTKVGMVDLPILYYDTSAFMAFFTADIARARSLLSGTGLKPVPLLGGQTLVGVAAYEYRSTTVGVYNEVGLAIAALPDGTPFAELALAELLLPSVLRRLGFYVADLPVTTAEANAAGREIWGYPKFVTKIPLTHSAANFDLKVMDPEAPQESIFELAGGITRYIRLPNIDLHTWSLLNGDLISTRVTTRGSAQYCLRPEMVLHLGKSSHAMRQHLELLGLDGKRPFAFSSSDDFQSILPEGKVMQP